MDFKIDYAVISNNRNPEYTKLFPYIQKRWNQLGIKTILVDVMGIDDTLATDPCKASGIKDHFGNIAYPIHLPTAPKILDRWFEIMISRFWIATHECFRDSVLVISDGDLFPINKKYIYQPSYKIDMYDTVNRRNCLVTTNQYPNGQSLATYTYGLGSTFNNVINCQSLKDLYKLAESLCYKKAKFYANDEHIMNYIYDTWIGRVCKIQNRKWLGMVQEMNNLYDYQIDLLNSWQDLCPFIEFHNMRASTMTEERWNKLFKLLEGFDKYNITPNNWFFESIIDPWTDTIITKNGELILGDEYK